MHSRHSAVSKFSRKHKAIRLQKYEISQLEMALRLAFQTAFRKRLCARLVVDRSQKLLKFTLNSDWYVNDSKCSAFSGSSYCFDGMKSLHE